MVDTQERFVWTGSDSFHLPEGWHIERVDARYRRERSTCTIGVTIADGRTFFVTGTGSWPGAAWVDARAKLERQARDWWFHHHLECAWRMHNVTAVFYERKDATDDTGGGMVPIATAMPHAAL